MPLRRAIVLAGLALAACGGDEAAERPERTPAPAPAATPAGGFPDRPQVELGGRSLAAPGEGSRRAAAPRAAEPGSQAVTVVATVRAPEELDGRAGVFCRGSADGRSGYELTVDRRGRVELDRVEDGRRTLLAGYSKRIDTAVDPSQPLPVMLACGRGDRRGVTLGVLVGVGQFTYVRDRRPVDPGPRGEAGLVASGGTADFAALQLYFAPAG